MQEINCLLVFFFNIMFGINDFLSYKIINIGLIIDDKQFPGKYKAKDDMWSLYLY